MLVGLEAFLAEFDWGVPLYRQVWQPLFLAGAAGFVLTAGRAWAGRGGALGTWGAYLLIRLAASLMPVLAGRSAALLPLFLVEALLVETVALRLSPRLRPLAFGALAGLACGTVGFAAEYGWSQIAMPLPWTEGLLAEGIPTAALAGVAGGLLGSLLGSGLRGMLPPQRTARLATIGSFAILVGLGVNAAIKTCPRRPRPSSSPRPLPRLSARPSRGSPSTLPTPPRTPTGSTSSPGREERSASSTGSSRWATASTAPPSPSRCTGPGSPGFACRPGAPAARSPSGFPRTPGSGPPRGRCPPRSRTPRPRRRC